MKIKWQVWSLLVLFVATGCWQKSLHPFYSPKTVVEEGEIIGSWQEKEKQEAVKWVFSAKGNKTYLLEIEDGPKGAEYDAHLFTLGDTLFLDIQSRARELSAIPAHHLFRVNLSNNVLELRALSMGWIEEHGAELSRIYIPDLEDPQKKEIVLTAATEDLQKFLLKHLAEEELFGDAIVLERNPAGETK